MTKLPYKNKRSIPYGKSGCRRPVVTAVCTCGKEFDVLLSSLTKKSPTKSCGCIRKGINSTHRMTKTGIYRIWSSMKDRCCNPNYKEHHLYGGRGINISPEWYEFINFYRDMGEKPKGKSLDRINNNLGYSKENCAWKSLYEQSRNTRSNRKYKGECATDAGIRLGGTCSMITKRIKRGWTIQKAFTTPAIPNKKLHD